MKQRFLNQKLGKRNSRRAELQKAKSAFEQSKYRRTGQRQTPRTGSRKES